jgi:hypothetical protein
MKRIKQIQKSRYVRAKGFISLIPVISCECLSPLVRENRRQEEGWGYSQLIDEEIHS